MQRSENGAQRRNNTSAPTRLVPKSHRNGMLPTIRLGPKRKLPGKFNIVPANRAALAASTTRSCAMLPSDLNQVRITE